MITMQELLQEILDTSIEYIEKKYWKKLISRPNAPMGFLVAIREEMRLNCNNYKHNFLVILAVPLELILFYCINSWQLLLLRLRVF